MRLDHRTRTGSWVMALAAGLLRGLIGILGRSWRLEVVAGGEIVTELVARPRPVILAFWHNRAFLGTHFLYRRLHRQGFRMTVLASQSRDGELISRVIERWGLAVVRGSASRGGREALRALYRAVVSHGTSPVMIPDGPRGPLYELKLGTLVLAQMAQAPILPLGFAAQRCWRIRSWDRLIVPRPFTRCAVVVGPLQAVPRGLAGEALEAERQRQEALLSELTRQAEAHLGVSDPLLQTAVADPESAGRRSSSG